jgi:hypothetical protein
MINVSDMGALEPLSRCSDSRAWRGLGALMLVIWQGMQAHKGGVEDMD